MNAGFVSSLLERFRGWRRARRTPKRWSDMAKLFLEEDRKAGRVRNRETEEKLRCGWSYLHGYGKDKDDVDGGPRDR